MNPSLHLRIAAVLLSSGAVAQSLPPAQPTAAPQPATPVQTAPAAHRAQVTWDQGQLQVVANNSSLNGILRDVALRTGMKINGGVAEERVFGTYGPAPANTVLKQLLTGTQCNMMLQMDSAGLPILLTLSPLTGGVTPPNPMQAAPEPEDQPQQPVQQEQTAAPQPPPAAPVRQPQPDDTPANTNSSDTPASGQPQSPNGVKTPQQIFEELQKLHQKQTSTTPQ